MKRIFLYLLLFSISLNAYIIKHNFYTLDYSEFHRQATWVSYTITYEMLNGEKFKRKNDFRKDPYVKHNPVVPTDYKNTVYDKGHLSSAGDFIYSKKAISESFYMSNMSPQLPGFNRGIWKKLETKVRAWAIKFKYVEVITGGILSGVNETINGITIPKRFYKVIYDKTNNKSIGFIIENKKSYKDLKEFVFSVNEVEEITGIDFFGIDEIIEDQKNWEDWDGI